MRRRPAPTRRGWAGVAIVALALLTGCEEREEPAGLNRTNAVGTPEAPVVPEAGNGEAAPPPVASPPMARIRPPAREAAPAPRADDASEPEYRAIGTEPFWAVRVDGAVALLERPDAPPQRFLVRRQDDGRALRYLGEGFALVITQGPCSDGMSDAVWSDRAQLSVADAVLKGCGGTRAADEDGGW